MSYSDFIRSKSQIGGFHGFEPTYMPEKLFDYQQYLVEWATRKGRAAIFADCGMGKTFMQLAWAQNIVEREAKPVLILAPLMVSVQTVEEAGILGVEASRKMGTDIVVTNYERLHQFDPADFSGLVCDESSILKNFDGAYRSQITEFMRLMKFRLLCSATPSPNDYTELGTSEPGAWARELAFPCSPKLRRCLTAPALALRAGPVVPALRASIRIAFNFNQGE